MQLTQILKTFRTSDYSRYYSQKDCGKFKATYISWFDICNILDEATDGLWEWRITATREGDRVVIVGELTVIDSEGNKLTKSATGNEADVIMSYGDPVSNAEAMCLRRAAAKFGIGRELWEKPVNQVKPSNQARPAPVNTSQGTMTRQEWEAKFKR